MISAMSFGVHMAPIFGGETCSSEVGPALGRGLYQPGRFPGHAQGPSRGPAVTRPLETCRFPPDNYRGEKGWHVALERAEGPVTGLK